jgi:hypothetical protein
LLRKEPFPNNYLDFDNKIVNLMENKFSHLKKGSIEYQLKKADTAIEQLGKTVEYVHYKP